MLDQPEEIYLGIETPFHLELTVRALQRRPNNNVDVWENGRYYRVLPTENGNRLAIVEMMRPAEVTQLKVSIEGGAVSDRATADIAAKITFMLSLNVDLSPFYQIAKDDPQLKEPVKALCGLKPPRFPNLFETFVNAVLFQQISLEAALAIRGRLVDRFGDRMSVNGRIYHAFPNQFDIARADSDELRRLGLSARKADVILNMANMALSSEMDFLDIGTLTSQRAIERLVKLPGIGPWSAELILLRGLGRLDVFPGGDVGARRNMARLVGAEGSLSPEEERRILERYGNYKGFLYFCALIWGGLQTGVFPASPPASGCF